MGVAGSLGNLLSDCTFHVVDTVNIRAKASEKAISSFSMFNRIWAKEGVYGFGKGFSACFYGGAISGFCYFAFYKWLKGVFKENFGDKVDPAFFLLAASFTAEFMTLFFQYPYDLIKCRLQSVNYIFKYQNLVHAFKKEIHCNGVTSLYNGATPFLFTYTTFVAL